MHIILIGNYIPDRQESMQRFAHMLQKGFGAEGISTEIWYPTVFFGSRFKSTSSGIGKWFGYMDKWVLFPLVLRIRQRRRKQDTASIRYHICDHSNSPYLPHLPPVKTVITCHDVLAIRGAFGFEDAYCPASPMGVKLQQWILRNLVKARKLASVSTFTYNQLRELAPAAGNTPAKKEWCVILNGFNADFRPMKKAEATPYLSKAGLDASVPYILHVGSGHQRKNRRMLVDMVAILGNRWNGNICFAGEAVEEELMQHAEQLGLRQRVISLVGPDAPTLVALYSHCAAFIFPSLSEGFGWPLIEAQACGVPVIASNIAPMPEVSGGAALHADPHNPEAFANAFLCLNDQVKKTALVQEGLKNIERFEPAKMIRAYLDLHRA